MNTKDDFPWKKNDLLSTAYEGENYLICETGNPTGRAVIFFSSNGIYYPNDEETFIQYIAKENDGFEWYHLAKHRSIQKYFQKIIFLRDIYKQWYITGINSRFNSVDKVFEFLQEEVHGFQVYTCGTSSGGYAAALFGALLQADRIFVNAGQFFIQPIQRFGPFVEGYYSDYSRGRYYDLSPIIQTQPNIFYIFPALSPNDVDQFNHIKDLRNIFTLHIKCATHGNSIESICWPFLLTLNQDALINLFQKHHGKIIDKRVVKIAIVPFGDRVLSLLRRIIRKLRSLSKLK